MDGSMTNDELEGRLAAHRQVLQWLLARAVRSPEQLADLREHIDLDYPPLDHQEDPGAVPTAAFATSTAASIEFRTLLEPVSLRLEGEAGRETNGQNHG